MLCDSFASFFADLGDRVTGSMELNGEDRSSSGGSGASGDGRQKVRIEFVR
jgi:hypothetical protein